MAGWVIDAADEVWEQCFVEGDFETRGKFELLE